MTKPYDAKCDFDYDYEIAVIGSGPAGAITAFILARSGLDVALIDKLHETHHPKVGETLPGAAVRILTELSLGEILKEPTHLRSYGVTSQWGQSDTQYFDNIYDPYGRGWHLNRDKFDADLRRAATVVGAQWLNDRVTGAIKQEHGYRLKLRSSDIPIAAKFVVDATGRSAQFARRLGIKRLMDSRLGALYGYLSSSKNLFKQTMIESSEDGWWYSAPLPGDKRVMAFFALPEYLDELRAETKLLEDSFNKTRLLSSNDWFRDINHWHYSNASGGYLERVFGDGWCAVGDAALSFDPLSSQGMFNAIATGKYAASAILKTQKGSQTAFSQYQEAITDIRQAYLRHHRAYYHQGSPNPINPFWCSQNQLHVTS